jgi:hypothetical protein
VLAGQIITLLPEGIGEMLLVDERAFVIMGVLVAFAVS